MKQYMEDKDKRAEIQQKDGEVRMALEGKPVNESKEDIIKASNQVSSLRLQNFPSLVSIPILPSMSMVYERCLSRISHRKGL